MNIKEFDSMINKLNTNRTVELKSYGEKCRVIAHSGIVYVFEHKREKPYMFQGIEEFRTRFTVFNEEVLLLN